MLAFFNLKKKTNITFTPRETSTPPPREEYTRLENFPETGEIMTASPESETETAETFIIKNLDTKEKHRDNDPVLSVMTFDRPEIDNTAPRPSL